MTAFRIFAALIVLAVAYLSFALEVTAGGRTLLPHAPAVFLILASWSLPALSAIFAAAAIGLTCDAIGQGPLGPGLVTAVLVVFIAGGFRRRWELESLLAVMLFATAVSLAFLAGRDVIAAQLTNVADLAPPLQLLAARAVASALAALALVMLARFAAKATSGFAAMLLSH